MPKLVKIKTKDAAVVGIPLEVEVTYDMTLLEIGRAHV